MYLDGSKYFKKLAPLLCFRSKDLISGKKSNETFAVKIIARLLRKYLKEVFISMHSFKIKFSAQLRLIVVQ